MVDSDQSRFLPEPDCIGFRGSDQVERESLSDHNLFVCCQAAQLTTAGAGSIECAVSMRAPRRSLTTTTPAMLPLVRRASSSAAATGGPARARPSGSFTAMSRTRPRWTASAAQAADCLRLAGAWGSAGQPEATFGAGEASSRRHSSRTLVGLAFDVGPSAADDADQLQRGARLRLRGQHCTARRRRAPRLTPGQSACCRASARLRLAWLPTAASRHAGGWPPLTPRVCVTGRAPPCPRASNPPREVLNDLSTY